MACTAIAFGLYNDKYKKLMRLDAVDCVDFALSDALGQSQLLIGIAELELWFCLLPIHIRDKLLGTEQHFHLISSLTSDTHQEPPAELEPQIANTHQDGQPQASGLRKGRSL